MPGPVRSLPPTKKRKVHESGSAEKVRSLEEELTRAIQSNASLNPLADLLDLVLQTKAAQTTSKGIYAIYRIFVLVISADKLGHTSDESAKIVKTWLLERLNTYVNFLCGLLQDTEKVLRLSALDILMSLQKHLSTLASKSSQSSSDPQPQFHNAHFRKLVTALLVGPPSLRPGGVTSKDPSSPIDGVVLHKFYDTWFSVHDDIRWFFLREAATVLNTHHSETYTYVASNLLSLLERLTTFPTEEKELNSWWISELGKRPPKPKPKRGSHEDAADSDLDSSGDDEAANRQGGDGNDDDWRKFFEDEPAQKVERKMKGPGMRLNQMTIHQSLHSLASHKAVFTRAWLTLLPRLAIGGDLEASRGLAMRALNIMHQGVMPHLTRPIMVMDWIAGSVDYGGTVGLLALNALFLLIKDYNLDYPSFYTRLYAFLDRDLLHLKHRARFFRLTELFLSSTHLPATLLASFVKRLARLSLSAPPAAIVMIIPFTYNILKRHPALMVMIHRHEIDGGGEQQDPFLPTEKNPVLTQALSSSLWELNSHSSHYYSGASTLAKIFSEAFTKPSYPMEDFLDHTYATLIDTDTNRKIKREPPLSINLGKAPTLFPPIPAEDEADDEKELSLHLTGDVVTELWGF